VHLAKASRPRLHLGHVQIISHPGKITTPDRRSKPTRRSRIRVTAAVVLGDDGPDAGRTFDYVLTYDRELVLEVARSLMTRTLPATGTPLVIPAQSSSQPSPAALAAGTV